MNTFHINHQRGIGIVEVMIALLLLAIAVLGFSAMQLTAVKATDESLVRTRALAIMRGGAENMRGYADGIPAFRTALNGTANSITVDGKAITVNSCLGSDECTPAQLATKDAMILRNFATTQEIRLGLHTCPGTQSSAAVAATDTSPAVAAVRAQDRQCMIASWGNTTSTFGQGGNNCADNNGVQNPGATCFVMEAY